ncbi:hypothetical protein IHE45_05G045900 [Dioscorea alata]|uniref:Uncharacterized protein n=1 Tax=Dioscorea alata TaxID=55571 RepID=A0ACB7W144_DIOAL|nr:hypothetical protein IHE45_05G045900 [Dioscorea alata]
MKGQSLGSRRRGVKPWLARLLTSRSPSTGSSGEHLFKGSDEASEVLKLVTCCEVDETWLEKIPVVPMNGLVGLHLRAVSEPIGGGFSDQTEDPLVVCDVGSFYGP